MAIQLRRGDYADFDPTKLLDGELAVVLDNDPNTDDGTGLYASFGDDNVKRLLTADESLLNYIGTATFDTTAVGYVATMQGFTLATGAVIILTFEDTDSSHTYSTSAVTLNINDTGAVQVRSSSGSIFPMSNVRHGVAVTLVYDGTYWRIVGELNNPYTTVVSCNSATSAGTAIKSVNSATRGAITELRAGMTIILTLTSTNTATPSSLQLKLFVDGSQQTVPIKRGGQALTQEYNLVSGVPYLLRYVVDPSPYWNLIGAMPLSLSEYGGAPLDSPNFTGTPTVPTAASGSYTSQIANTQFVQDAARDASVRWATGIAYYELEPQYFKLINYELADFTAEVGSMIVVRFSDAGIVPDQVASLALECDDWVSIAIYHKNGQQCLQSDLAYGVPLLLVYDEVPGMTDTYCWRIVGEYTLPSSVAPAMDGTAAVGTSDAYARADHVHPTDTSRASTAVATTSANGLMSATDKSKLDGIDTDAISAAIAEALDAADQARDAVSANLRFTLAVREYHDGTHRLAIVDAGEEE